MGVALPSLTLTLVSLPSVPDMANDSTPAVAGGANDRTALVTGGGSGIGRAVAVALAERGMDVVVAGRRADALTATAHLHAGIRTHVGDVSEPGDVAEMVRAATAASGRVDVLVNNAGMGLPAPLGRIEPDAARRIWEVNVLGSTLLTQAALPFLIDSGGVVVNVSSTFGTRPAPRISQYGAAKAAVEHLTRSWALELAGHGVRVNAVAPGPTESEALHAMGLSSAEIERLKADEQQAIPLGRRGRPEDVAAWIVALADPAIWVTGQVIAVDGGFGLA